MEELRERLKRSAMIGKTINRLSMRRRRLISLGLVEHLNAMYRMSGVMWKKKKAVESDHRIQKVWRKYCKGGKGGRRRGRGNRGRRGGMRGEMSGCKERIKFVERDIRR